MKAIIILDEVDAYQIGAPVRVYFPDSMMTDGVAEALEPPKEQEPIKPTVSVDTWICSKCGHTLESQELIDDKENPQVLIHELYQYCPNCGKKVK